MIICATNFKKSTKNRCSFFYFTIERDKKKLILCKENGIKLLYYDSEHKHTEFLGEKVYNNENNIIKEITSYEQKN